MARPFKYTKRKGEEEKEVKNYKVIADENIRIYSQKMTTQGKGVAYIQQQQKKKVIYPHEKLCNRLRFPKQ